MPARLRAAFAPAAPHLEEEHQTGDRFARRSLQLCRNACVRVAARGFARRNISGNWTTRIGSGLGVSKQSGKQFILRRRERVRDCDSFPREAFLQVLR
jgi:hypothetical protein